MKDRQHVLMAALPIPPSFVGMHNWHIVRMIANFHPDIIPLAFIFLFLIGLVAFLILIWSLDLPGLFSGRRPYK